jgi:hypothetical protein
LDLEYHPENHNTQILFKTLAEKELTLQYHNNHFDQRFLLKKKRKEKN